GLCRLCLQPVRSALSALPSASALGFVSTCCRCFPPPYKENWNKYEDLAFKYAPLEQKKSVKLLLCQYMAEEQDDADRTCAYTLDLLSAFLGTNRSGGQSMLSVFEVLCLLCILAT
ncbi:hypothetical protein GBAR_LOCUS30244, partial [Geodia barretti]